MTPGGAPGAPAGPRFLAAEALPACFGELSHPPEGLWYVGASDDLLGAPERHVAIVGTREASSYGLRTAARLATACARAGLVVVSGLARGVDAAAHEAAMRAGGRTIAVLGTGVDVPYPVGHRTLLQEVGRHGLAISEMEPGALARPGCFPRRNRLIAALARVVVVVEAGFKSGAINTASHALDLGRIVAAVPGQIDDPRAAGANGLCRDGAQVITSVEDLLTLAGISTSGRLRTPPAAESAAGTAPEFAVVDGFARDPWSPRPDPVGGTDRGPELSVRQVARDILLAELGAQPGAT